MKNGSKTKYLEENFRPIVAESFSFSEVCRNLGIATYCGNRDTVKKYIEQYNIDISHFTFGGGRQKKGNRKFFSNEEVFIKDSPIRWNQNLKNRILKDNLLDYKCTGCGNQGEWMGKKISLILDHINGDSNDNRITNLRFVCPNCNAALPTAGIKNMGDSKKRVSIRKSCNCGKILPLSYKEDLCPTCQKKDEMLPPGELKKLYDDEGSQEKLAKRLGLTRRVIGRWIKEYKLQGLW